MKILAVSDTGFAENSIREYERMVDSSNPDVIIMAGDYDEGEALFLPRKHDFRESLLFAKEHKLDSFYEFLEYCGKTSQVLVIRGNHEIGDTRYSPEKINSIRGCHEISDCGMVEVKGCSFLGIGYTGNLLPIVKRFAHTRIDVIITHCEKSRLNVLTRLKPRLMIHGHAASGSSVYSINHIPAVSTGVLRYAEISFDNKGVRSMVRVRKQRTRFPNEGGFSEFWF